MSQTEHVTSLASIAIAADTYGLTIDEYIKREISFFEKKGISYEKAL